MKSKEQSENQTPERVSAVVRSLQAREIKYRTWIDNKLVYGLENTYDFELTGFTDGIWMRYIGIKDKNGKEIYEGDIVNKFLGRPFIINPQIIFYREIGGQAYLDNFFMSGCEHSFEGELEVIGNIFENIELYDLFPEY